MSELNADARANRIEWEYTPADLFEETSMFDGPDCQLELNKGRATAIAASGAMPLSAATASEIELCLKRILACVQITAHQKCVLHAPRIFEMASDGSTKVTVQLRGSMSGSSKLVGHLTVKDSSGYIVSDSKRDRSDEDKAFILSVSSAMPLSPVLEALVNSYIAAVADPANELVHLYEIPERLQKHYKGETNAQVALGISSPKWKKLKALANANPLNQGRHRGAYDSTQPATTNELNEARNIAKSLIRAFAKSI